MFTSETGTYFGKTTKRGEGKDRKALREAIASLVSGDLTKFTTEMNKLEGTAYIDRFIQLFEFALPKLQRTELVGDEENPLEIINKETDKELIDRVTKLIGNNNTVTSPAKQN